MRWSFKIGRIAGIDVYMHLTFLLLLAWIGYMYYAPRQSVEDAFWGIVYILTIFVTVVLHELGHALAARRYGIETRDITLLPIGGVARLERMPKEPWQELAVAVAGPLVNVVIAAGLLVGILATGGSPLPEAVNPENSLFVGTFAQRLLVVNVWLVVFNAIPAFPMDGGRVLRAFLAMSMDYAQATSVAAVIGQGIAFLFAIVGLLGGNFILLFIALFVWMGAAGEASVAQLQAAIAGIPVRRAMIEEFVTVRPESELREVANHVLRGFQVDYPVVDADNHVVGVLPQAELLAGLSSDGPSAPVGRFMRTDFKTAAPNEMLDRAVSRLQEGTCPVLPVLDDGRLVGLLTAENVGELVMIREAIKARRDRYPRPAGPAAAPPLNDRERPAEQVTRPG
jgi:Zn-dependent protease/predicted transcriptional regulator